MDKSHHHEQPELWFRPSLALPFKALSAILEKIQRRIHMKNVPPRDEIWFRKIYADLVRNRQVTTIFRPGKRKKNDPKGFHVGETLRIRIIDKVGADWAGVIGQVYPDFEMPVRVLDVVACPIGELTAEDFKGSTPDVLDAESLIYHLGVLYNLSRSDLTAESIVTKTTFEYL